MEVVLLKDVEKLGEKGTVASVSDGYARNYLFPRKLAEVATPARVEAIRRAVAEKEERERREAEQAGEIRDLLARTVLTVAAQAGQGEKLFGSITSQDIVEAIYTARRLRVDKRKVLLEDPIRTLGPHMVKIDVHPSVEPAEVKVLVVPEGGSA
ncbi:MAG: 50S ribosomal protein L9 [Thermoleophilia bacterium]